MSPLVSVIVPNYNHARFLRERLDSVLAQSYVNVELIVLDDASTDDSLALIRDYQARHPGRIDEVLVNERNTGTPFAQWNKGVAAARGELVWIAESDDVADPALLERLVPSFDDPAVVLAYCRSRLIDEAGQDRGVSHHVPRERGHDRFAGEFKMPGQAFLRQGQLASNLVPNASAVLFRRSAYLACGGADVRVEKCADWLVWCKLLLAGAVSYVSAPLNGFRRHGGSVIANAGGRIALMHYDLGFHTCFADYLDGLPETEKTAGHAAIAQCNREETLRLRQRLACALARSRQWREARGLHQALKAGAYEGRCGPRYWLRYWMACVRGVLRGR